MIFVGIMLSVFQQAVGINAVFQLLPPHFDTMGMGNPMVQTVSWVSSTSFFTLLAVFMVEKWGRKPPVDLRLDRHGCRRLRRPR